MDPYRGIAPVYDVVTSAFLHGPRKALAQACASLGARRILDVGCGTGILTRMLCPDAELVVGLDASPAMLAKALCPDSRSPARGGAQPRFILADAADPPFQSRSFDLLIFALTLHETDADAAAMLRKGLTAAPLALILEWRMPERNLDYMHAPWMHAIERLAGRDHYRHFRTFMRGGGLRGLAQRADADIIYEKPLKAGSLSLGLLRAKD